MGLGRWGRKRIKTTSSSLLTQIGSLTELKKTWKTVGKQSLCFDQVKFALLIESEDVEEAVRS